MSNLSDITERHGRDRWKDALFIGFAVLLLTLSIGSVASHDAGKPLTHHWSVTVVENPELAR